MRAFWAGLRNIHQILWISVVKSKNAVKRDHKQSTLIPAYQNPPQSAQNWCLKYWANIGLSSYEDLRTDLEIGGFCSDGDLKNKAWSRLINQNSSGPLSLETKSWTNISKSQMRDCADKTKQEKIPSFPNPPQRTGNRRLKYSSWMRAIWIWAT